jgi:uroporphyrinogen decarboxylase
MFSHLRKPNKDRLLTTLRRGKADAVPNIELGVDPYIKSTILGRKWNSIKDEVEFNSMMGYDYIKLQPIIQLDTKRRIADSLSKNHTGANVPDRSWSSEQTGIITTFEDFERYPWPLKNEINYSRFKEVRSILPDGMAVIGQYGDIFTTAWEMMGFETFAVSIYTEPDLVKAIMEKVGELIISMFETMADMEWVDVLWYSDDIAYTEGLMLNPEFYREHFFPLLKKIGDMSKRRDVPFIYHSDGDLWSVMDDIVGAGVSALHPIEPKGLNIKELKEKRGHQLCLCGGIDLDLLARVTPEEIKTLVRNILAVAAPGGGYCAGSSNSITEYVKVENYLAMLETVIIEGKY